MTIAMQPIYTQTLGAAGASSITFNNIPQQFTDLKLVMSARDNETAADNISFLTFNGDTSSGLYSMTRLFGTGSSTPSDRYSAFNFIYGAHANASTGTANTFTSCEIYIPNYGASAFKSTISDYIITNSSGAAYQVLVSGLWRNTNAITSVSITSNLKTFVQHSTFSLYGITKG
jgi:hypothetical protein